MLSNPTFDNLKLNNLQFLRMARLITSIRLCKVTVPMVWCLGFNKLIILLLTKRPNSWSNAHFSSQFIAGYVVQYGEFGRWSLVGVKVCLTTNSPNTVHTFCSGLLGRIKVEIFGALLIYLEVLNYSVLLPEKYIKFPTFLIVMYKKEDWNFEF